jgi:hypothetical protein
MENDPLDTSLRETLSGSAPADVHRRAAPHFDTLAARMRDRTTPPARPTRPAHRTTWWAGLGVFGTAAAAVVILGLVLAPLRAEVEFVGILATSEKTMFYLKDAAAGKESGWVELKQTFAGYIVTAYDAKNDVLTLTKDGAITQIRLRDAKVINGRQEVMGGITLQAGEKLVVERATLIFDQENVFPLKNGVIVRITPKRWTDGNIMHDVVFERPRPDGGIEKLSSPKVLTLPDRGFSVMIGEPGKPEESIGLSFKPTGAPVK